MKKLKPTLKPTPRFNLAKFTEKELALYGERPRLRYEPNVGFAPAKRPILCPKCIAPVINFGYAYACIPCRDAKATLPEWAGGEKGNVIWVNTVDV